MCPQILIHELILFVRLCFIGIRDPCPIQIADQLNTVNKLCIFYSIAISIDGNKIMVISFVLLWPGNIMHRIS